MLNKLTTLLYWLMVPLGLGFAWLAWPMLTGQEELTRWTTHAIANGTAMFFMVSIGALFLVQWIAKRRAEDHRLTLRWWVISYGVCFLLMGAMSIATPFGL